MRRTFVVFLGLVLSLLAAPSGADAQVTTSSVTGVVRTNDGAPVAGAQVVVLNAATGFQTGALTNENGRYTVTFLEPGGPYTISVQNIGYGTQTQEGVSLSLGQTARFDFTLTQQAIELEGLEVTYDPTYAQSRTGQQTIITDEQLLELPTISRNFTELASLSPLVSSTGAPSIAGQNNRFNNIQIDGAVNNDVFGLASSGVPGGQANGKPISQDAIAQFQVLVAPFDVRQAGFTGGLINAVTKSGTNDFDGTLYTFWRNESLERGDFTANDDNFSASEPFTNAVVGGTFGGPIIRDKLHFFVSGEFEVRDNPLNAGIDDLPEDLGITPATVNQIQGIAEGQYNLPFGRTTAYTRENPARNLFGRLDWQVNETNRLSLKYTYASADFDDNVSRGGDRFEPESAAYVFTNETNSFVGQLFSQVGEWSNEALVNFQFIRDRRANPDEFLFGQVTVENPADAFNEDANIRFGTERFSHANELDQDVFQFTNNLSRTIGNSRWTLGFNAERINFRNLFAATSLGQWEFLDVASFQNGGVGAADFFQIAIPSPGLGSNDIRDTAARFAYWNLEGYIQNELTIGENLVVTPGIRVSVPITADEPRNNTQFAADFPGLQTNTVPSGNPMIQPRLGFNYKIDGQASNQLRGGAGIFAGRPPFVWMSNAFGNTGLETALVTCRGSNTPAFDARNPPTQCADGSGAAASSAPIALVDDDFVWPTDFRLNLAWDKEWEGGWRTSFEGLYTQAINAVAVEELNGNAVPGVNIDAADIGNRQVFGRPVDDFRQARTPIRISNNFDDVIRLRNTSEPYSYALIGEVEKNFGRNYALSAAYTYSRSYDIQAFTSSRAVSNYGFSPIGAEVGVASLDLTPSNFDRPHRVILSATGRWNDGRTIVSAIYRGQSGAPYSYIYRSDINGDGFGDNVFDNGRTNDLVYIPVNSSDLNWRNERAQERFDLLMSQEECLQDQRGQIMERNSCRRPWAGFMDVRVSQKLPTPRGDVELILDVFNFANLLNEDWGTQLTSGFATERLLEVQGREGDLDTGRLIFDYEGPLDFDGESPVAELPHRVAVNTTRYRINLGLRWIF